MAEIWKGIPGYEDLYEVSDQGRMRSRSTYHGRTTKGERHWLRKCPGRKPFGEKNPMARLTIEQVRAIKLSVTGKRGECANLSLLLGVPYSTVRNVITGHRWKHVGV